MRAERENGGLSVTVLSANVFVYSAPEPSEDARTPAQSINGANAVRILLPEQM